MLPVTCLPMFVHRIFELIFWHEVCGCTNMLLLSSAKWLPGKVKPASGAFLYLSTEHVYCGLLTKAVHFFFRPLMVSLRL